MLCDRSMPSRAEQCQYDGSSGDGSTRVSRYMHIHINQIRSSHLISYHIVSVPDRIVSYHIFVLGMEKTIGRLVCDPGLDAHVIDVVVQGPGTFKVDSNRYNPAAPGAVTGNATYMSFVSSMIAASRFSKGDGVHFC